MDEKTTIKLIETYFRNHKYDPKRLNHTKMPLGHKSPDFEVCVGEEVKFLCELKTLDLSVNPKTNMFHWNTTISKLREHISKASKQLKSHDKDHSTPWVMVITSTHFQLNWTSMVHCIRGSVGFNGQLIKDLTNQRFIQATEDELKSIDIYVWAQANAKDNRIYQMAFFVSSNSQLLDKSNKIVDKLIPYESEDIMDINSKKFSSKSFVPAKQALGR